MTFVRAIGGDVDTAELGLVDAHEHLVAHATPELVAAEPDLLLDRPDAVREDLAAFLAAGGGAIVEMTTIDYGRDLAALAELSASSGVHVIAATGFNKGKYCRRYCEGVSARTLADTQVADIAERRCGIVKFATSLDTIEPWEQTALEAAARTQLETGCPILTHTEAGTMAEEQLTLLTREGVAADAVVVGHMDRNPDFETHLRVAARGAYVSYDQIPKPKYATGQRSIDFVAKLAEHGLHDRVLVGGDLARRSYFTGWGGGPGLAYLVGEFRSRLAAALEARGLEAEAIVQAIFHDNPARALRMRA